MDAAPSRSDSGDCWHAVGEAGGRCDWSDGIPTKRRRTERNRIVYRVVTAGSSEQLFLRTALTAILTPGAPATQCFDMPHPEMVLFSITMPTAGSGRSARLAR